jgi:hypothetical protein
MVHQATVLSFTYLIVVIILVMMVAESNCDGFITAYII